MTEVEMLDLTTSHLDVVAAFMSNYATHVSIYLSLVFGYCVAAFAAGDKLTRFQVIIASFMFFAAAELQASLMFLWASGARGVLMSLAEFNPNIEGTEGSEGFGLRKVAGISVIQLGILASLAFMWNVRHTKTK